MDKLKSYWQDKCCDLMYTERLTFPEIRKRLECRKFNTLVAKRFKVAPIASLIVMYQECDKLLTRKNAVKVACWSDFGTRSSIQDLQQEAARIYGGSIDYRLAVSARNEYRRDEGLDEDSRTNATQFKRSMRRCDYENTYAVAA